MDGVTVDRIQLHSMWKLTKIAIYLAGLITILSLGGCAGMDVGYISRVLVRQDASTEDYLWKRSESVKAPLITSQLALNYNRGAVQSAFLAEEDIDKLEHYLQFGKTHSLLILRDGELIYEWYGEGVTQGDPAAAFSISKTVVALLVARAIEAGEIRALSSPITEYVPDLAQSDRGFRQITLRDLIDMRSGIGFSDKVSFPWLNQDAAAIYHATDLAATVRRRAKIHSPPGDFLYNDYLGAEFPAAWSVDKMGFAWHESGLVIAARDLMRLGRLMLEKGRVNNRQVAPKAFLDRSLNADGRGVATRFGSTAVGYRSGWWTALSSSDAEDIFAMGRHGQIMLVSAKNKIVIVRLGRDGNRENNIAMVSRLRRVADRLGNTRKQN